MTDRPDPDAAISAIGRSALRHDPAALRAFNRDVVAEFRAAGGVVGGPFAGADVLLLTTTGARSGEPRLTPLEYFTVGGRTVVVGSYGGAPRDPAWVHNLRADTAARVEIGDGSRDVVARELAGDERETVFARIRSGAPRFDEYQSRAGRPLPLFDLT